jgi:hypothetical protein
MESMPYPCSDVRCNAIRYLPQVKASWSTVVDEYGGGGGLDVEVVVAGDGEVPHPAGAVLGVMAAEGGGGGAAGGAEVGAVFEGGGFDPPVGGGCPRRGGCWW